MSLINEIDIYSRLVKLDEKASSFDTKLLLAEDEEGGDNADDDEDSEPRLKKRARNEEIFWCHRGLLSAHSGYFKGMFSSGMTESTSKTLSMFIPKGTLVVFNYVVEFVYNGFIKKPSLDELVRLCILSDYLQLENFKELIAGSFDYKTNFIELSQLASLHRYEFIGTQLLLNHSPLGCFLNVTQVDDVILLEKAKEAEDSMDEWMDNSRGTGYDEVGALFDLLWLFDESVLPTVVAIIAKTASIQWRSLKQLARLPLTVFVRLLLAIPFGDISENVFSEIILSYIDRRGLGTSEQFLTGADTQFLLGLIDTSVVTPDYLQCRLLDRLPAEKQAFLVETLPAFESLSYQFRCPLSLRHLGCEDEVSVLPCGHNVSRKAWSDTLTRRQRPIASSFQKFFCACPMVGCETKCTQSNAPKLGSNVEKRLLQHKKTKASRYEAAERWLDDATTTTSPSTSTSASAVFSSSSSSSSSSFSSASASAAATAVAIAVAVPVVSGSQTDATTVMLTNAVDLPTPPTMLMLEVVLMGVEEDEPILLPLNTRLNLTVRNILEEVAALKKVTPTSLIVCIPFTSSTAAASNGGGRLPNVAVSIAEYIQTYFNEDVSRQDPARFKSGFIPLYFSCFSTG